jgi:hypothetical protein
VRRVVSVAIGTAVALLFGWAAAENSTPTPGANAPPPSPTTSPTQPELIVPPAGLPVVFHVAQKRSRSGPIPVVDEQYLDGALERANAILIQAGLRFHRGAIKPLPTGRLLDIWGAYGRHALARAAGPPPPGAVEVFVVRTLRDLSRSAWKLPGVQWYTYNGKRIGRRYVIIAHDAGLETLAHELGHYFGLNHHPSRKNLMRPGAARVDSRLNSNQTYYMRQRLRYFMQHGVLNTP